MRNSQALIRGGTGKEPAWGPERGRSRQPLQDCWLVHRTPRASGPDPRPCILGQALPWMDLPSA